MVSEGRIDWPLTGEALSLVLSRIIDRHASCYSDIVEVQDRRGHSRAKLEGLSQISVDERDPNCVLFTQDPRYGNTTTLAVSKKGTIMFTSRMK